MGTREPHALRYVMNPSSTLLIPEKIASNVYSLANMKCVWLKVFGSSPHPCTLLVFTFV